MKKRTATVTQQHQVMISVEGKQAILRPAPRSLHSLAGSLIPVVPGLDPDERIRDAKEERLTRIRENHQSNDPSG